MLKFILTIRAQGKGSVQRVLCGMSDFKIFNMDLATRIVFSCLNVGFFVTLMQASASPQDTLRPVSLEQIEDWAKEARDSFQVPGFAIGVIKNGEVVLSKGFGVLSIAGDQSVDGATLFAIASNTKAFIGTAAAMLDEEGKLRLDDKVIEHLPYLKFSNPHVTALANVTDLMSHRAGLGTFKGDHLWFKRQLSPKQVLTQVEFMPLEYPFRAGYGYSNLGFIAAGEIISKTSGMPWSTFLERRIFKPLDMNRTVTSVSAFPDNNVAKGHISRQENKPIEAVPWETSGAAGGIWSSTDDMLKWIECNLNEGIFRSDTIWSPRVQAKVWKPRNVFGDNKGFNSYGLGWFLATDQGHTIALHGGGYDGMYSRVMLLPGDSLGIVVLTNSMTGLAGALSSKVRDAYLGVDNDDWLKNAMKRQRAGDDEWFARQDSVEIKLAAVNGKPDLIGLKTGKYSDPHFGTFAVAKTSAGYSLSFPEAPDLNASLAPAGGDHYRIIWEENHAWFDKGFVWLSRNGTDEVLHLNIVNDDIFYDSIKAVR